MPRVPDTSPEQELTILLQCAAEVEHGLMVQYLYAAYAAQPAAGDAAGELASIAAQEMGHLMTVQNLLIATGADPYFGRYDWSANPHFNPFPLKLEPFSDKVLAKYAACEMPDEKLVDEEERDLLPRLLADAAQSATMTPVRIGLLYAKLYWLVRENDAPLANPADEPWAGFPVAKIASIAVEAGRHVAGLPFGTARAWQADALQWSASGGGLIVQRVTSRPTALAALAAVAAQGEGFGAEDNGHFDRFAALYRSLMGGAGLSRAVPVNPWYAGVASPGDAANCIDEPVAARLAALGDCVYDLVLLATLLYLALPEGSQAANRGQLARASLACMRLGLRLIAEQGLTQIPRHPGVPAETAAAHLCFTRPATDLPGDYGALRQRTLAAAAEATALIALIDVATTPAGIRSLVSDVRSRAVTRLANVVGALPETL